MTTSGPSRSELPAEDSAKGPPPGRPPRRWGKLVFLALATAAIVTVYWVQRSGPLLPGWKEDLDAALVTARDELRPILVVFLDSPPGQLAHDWAKIPLSKKQNREALEKGNYILVKVTLDRAAREKWADRYRITKLPAMLLLGPDGKEKNRREAEPVGEVPFVREFLNCTVVQKPQ